MRSPLIPARLGLYQNGPQFRVWNGYHTKEIPGSYHVGASRITNTPILGSHIPNTTISETSNRPQHSVGNLLGPLDQTYLSIYLFACLCLYHESYSGRCTRSLLKGGSVFEVGSRIPCVGAKDGPEHGHLWLGRPAAAPVPQMAAGVVVTEGLAKLLLI